MKLSLFSCLLLALLAGCGTLYNLEVHDFQAFKERRRIPGAGVYREDRFVPFGGVDYTVQMYKNVVAINKKSDSASTVAVGGVILVIMTATELPLSVVFDTLTAPFLYLRPEGLPVSDGPDKFVRNAARSCRRQGRVFLSFFER